MEMKQWTRVRKKILNEERSKRSVMKEESLHYETLERMLAHPQPPGYKVREVKTERKIDPHLDWMEEVIRLDKDVHKKQRHTATRIFERLRDERGYDGGITVVKDEVCRIKKQTKEVFVPLVHHPGEAQVDFGHALLNVNGELGKYPFFAISLPYSDMFFVQMFPRECTETFQEGHVRAFNHWGKVPTRISYDNTTIAVSKITGSHTRDLTDGFLHLQSHYLFEEHFCRAARGNEKGVVEGMVKYTRSNYLVPVPQIRDLEEFNEELINGFERELQRQVRGKSKRKGELFKEDLAAMKDLPLGDFDACKLRPGNITSLSLVRFNCNDYSVPVAYAHRELEVKGYSNKVCIYWHGNLIAEHKRIWAKEQVSFEPLHYLALIEKKPGALDYARPLAEWKLPECFYELRRRLEAQEEGGNGVREYIKVLRLLEVHSMDRLRQAIASALRKGGITRDAIAQYIYPQEDYGSTMFSLDGHPHLQHVKVDSPDIANYNDLLDSKEEAL